MRDRSQRGKFNHLVKGQQILEYYPVLCRSEQNLLCEDFLNKKPKTILRYQRKYQLVENRQGSTQTHFLIRQLILDSSDIFSKNIHQDDLVTINSGSVKYFWKSLILSDTVKNIFL